VSLGTCTLRGDDEREPENSRVPRVEGFVV